MAPAPGVRGQGGPFASKSPQRRHPTRESPHLLLAEDDADLRVLVAEAFRRNGYRVTECVDGPGLVSKLGTYVLFGPPPGFDLVVSDIRMPGASALDVLESMRECQGMPPVILVTGFPSEGTRATARKLGVGALVGKPFEVDDLVEIANKLLSEPAGARP